MPLSHAALALLVAVIWGFNFVAIKVGVDAIPPLFLCALRFAFTAVPAILFLPRPPVPWPRLIAFGLALGVVKFGLVFTAIKLGVPAGLTSVVMQGQAFFTIVLAALLFGEHPTPVQIGGGFVALAGLAVMASDYAAPHLIGPFLMVVAASASWGVANIVVKSAGRVDMLAFLVWASLVPPLPLLALSVLVEGPAAIAEAILGLSWRGVGSVLFLAYPATLVAFGLWTWLVSRHPAPLIAPFSLLVPVFGVACTMAFLGESVSLAELIGGVLVLAGLAVTVLGPHAVKVWERRSVAP